MDSYHENLLMSQRVTKLSGKIFAVCSFTQEIRLWIKISALWKKLHQFFAGQNELPIKIMFALLSIDRKYILAIRL